VGDKVKHLHGTVPSPEATVELTASVLRCELGLRIEDEVNNAGLFAAADVDQAAAPTARDLLADGSENNSQIGAIAYRCGFEDPGLSLRNPRHGRPHMDSRLRGCKKIQRVAWMSFVPSFPRKPEPRDFSRLTWAPAFAGATICWIKRLD
jgi:hypothetical protein